jgi:hypothetical protein
MGYFVVGMTIVFASAAMVISFYLSRNPNEKSSKKKQPNHSETAVGDSAEEHKVTPASTLLRNLGPRRSSVPGPSAIACKDRDAIEGRVFPG